MADRNFDLDNVIKDSGNSTVFVYVDTTAIAYAMICCFGSLAESSSSAAGQGQNQEAIMNRMLSTLDKFLEDDKERRNNMIKEIKKAMNKKS
ncbi:hypothetical protein [Ammoniphilus sp. YIM 78166]|uniref:hypothetical protein n=1 Tax=Ammoniphilus sp. YIM 78166 TaxID=1644106 RepID=UPI00106F2A3D|nr:hypothetical protein [Ammoniphilus sp. YIM 78166]